MSFDAQGFLSPAIGRVRTSVREVAAYNQWFDFAEELNRLGLDWRMSVYPKPNH